MLMPSWQRLRGVRSWSIIWISGPPCMGAAAPENWWPLQKYFSISHTAVIGCLNTLNRRPCCIVVIGCQVIPQSFAATNKNDLLVRPLTFYSIHRIALQHSSPISGFLFASTGLAVTICERIYIHPTDATTVSPSCYIVVTLCRCVSVQLQMLGYDVSWAAFNVIEVMSSPKFTHKVWDVLSCIHY